MSDTEKLIADLRYWQEQRIAELEAENRDILQNSVSHTTHAEFVSDYQEQLDEKNAKIAELERELAAALFRLNMSFCCNVGGSGDCFSLFGRGVLEADNISLAAVTYGNSIKLQQSFDGASSGLITKEFDGTSQRTQAGLITFDDFTAERVIDVKRTFYNGHVYNLQTATSWYIANGLSIHNCRCWAEIPSKPVKPLRGYEVKE